VVATNFWLDDRFLSHGKDAMPWSDFAKRLKKSFVNTMDESAKIRPLSDEDVMAIRKEKRTGDGFV
jgi:hypothetical protein